MFDILMAKRADVNIQSSVGSTPLIWAAENNNLEMVNQLVDRGADVNKKVITALVNEKNMKRTCCD